MNAPCISDYRRGDEHLPNSPWAEDDEALDSLEILSNLMTQADSITEALGELTIGPASRQAQTLLTMDDTVGDASAERLIVTLFGSSDTTMALRALLELRQRVENLVHARALEIERSGVPA